MDKTELIIQFAHVLHLIAVDLFRFTGFCIFVGHQSGIIIDLWFTISDDRFAVGGFYGLV